jgi:hypothetical protein
MSNRLESVPATDTATETPPSADPARVRPEDTGPSWPQGVARQSAGRVWLVIGLATLLALAVGLVLAQGVLSSNKLHRPAQAFPDSPSRVAVAASGSGSILVSWAPRGANSVGYRIYRAQGKDGPYAIIGEVTSAIIHSYADSSALQTGATYWYRVTAFNRNGESRPRVASSAVVVLRKSPNNP